MSSEMCLTTTDLFVLTTGIEELHQRREASEKKLNCCLFFLDNQKSVVCAPITNLFFDSAFLLQEGPLYMS